MPISSGILQMMRVLVKLFGEFRAAAGRDQHALDLQDRATVAEALEALAESLPQLHSLMFDRGALRDHLHVFVNGRNVGTSGGLEAELHDGDSLTFFPPVGGG